MTQEKDFTSVLKCAHCSHNAPMEIVAKHSRMLRESGDYSYEYYDVYDLLLCPACSGITLRNYQWDGDDPECSSPIQTLYPSDNRKPLGLPPKIEHAHEAALRVRNIDANAYSILLRRVLEMVCLDRGADGEFLAKRIENLSAKGEIPRNLVEIAKRLKDLGNVGAHPSLGEITEMEIPILDQLCIAILEYVYSAPFLAERAKESLESLKIRKII